MAMSIVVVGSAALDSVETPHGKRDNSLGGSAIYFSLAASYFSPVQLVAVVGNDFPLADIEFLEDRGVSLEGLTVENGLTFRWGGRYHTNMNERDTLYTHLNVFEHFDPVLPASYRQTSSVFLANIQPSLQMKVLEQIADPSLVVMDTMNFWIENAPDQLKEVLKRVNVLLINDSETMQLGASKQLLKAAENIREMGPRIVVIKKGEHGALLVSDNGYFFAPAYPTTTVIDPTGAGDSFAGGFVGSLLQSGVILNDMNLRRAVIYGSVIASFCVEGFSIEKMKEVRHEEIDERFETFKRMMTID